MRFTVRFAPVLLAPLVLAACQGETKKAEDQRTAVGEILPGSVSDAMLPYDSLRSQPPLAPKAEGSGAAKAKRGDGPAASATTAGEGAPPAEAEAPAISAEPAAEAE
jgi:hypothetical protein